MIHHRTFANLALISDMLIAGPALALIAGIISQLNQNQFSQWISHSNFHRFNHQLHTHAFIALTISSILMQHLRDASCFFR
ncbi:hypothetical protein, partial [Escherichia coli]|uniref:hypothetical protein n=1 Tax=Escherichia coli TaxID=562 RepID=UPI00207B315E